MRVDAMPPTLVIDASVGLKWVIDEAGSEAAVAVAVGRGLVTSALFWAEAANVLATKERRGQLDRNGLDDAWRDLARAPIQTVALGQEGARAALGLAAELRHPVYDCCYLELALARGTVVVTADRRFRALADRHPGVAGHVVHLDELEG